MTFDTILAHATVVDGSGSVPFAADVGIHGEKIAAIGNLDEASAQQRVDLAGKILCPGFIDVHSHADMSVTLEDQPALFEAILRQGITTFVGGNCGIGLAPIRGTYRKPILDLISVYLGRDSHDHVRWREFGEYLEAVEKSGLVLNAAVLAPHGVLRIGTAGLSKRLATADEVRDMCDALDRCLEEGAVGMSTGLQYFPGSQADTEELVALGRVLRRHDAVFTSHLRSYSSNTLDLAIGEVKEVAREAGVRAQISHLFWIPHINAVVDRALRVGTALASKLYRRVRVPIPIDGAVARLLDELGREIEAGLPLGIDAMPTSAGFTLLFAFFPPWALEGDRAAILGRLRDPAARKRMRRDIERGRSIWPHREDHTWSMNFFKILGWDHIFIMSVVTEGNKHLEGMSIAELAASTGKHPFDAAADLLLEEEGRVLAFETGTHPGDDFVELSLRAAMRDPNVSIATDAILLGFGRPSHLFYDCFPKFMARYVREERLVSLAEGVRKCTSLPAAQIGIRERGLVRKGYWADLVVMDLDRVDTSATFERPDVFPTGIERVFVNGRAVVDADGYHPEPRAGRVLRRGQS
jgi:N-acyl-D-amino-acid deacylase